MIGQLRSELLKIRTTRTVAALALAAAAFTVLGALAEGMSRPVHELALQQHQRTMFSAAGGSAVLFATLAGLIIVTSEFRYGTIRPTLLVEPRRRVVLAAKLVAAMVVGVVFAVACVALSFGAGLAVLAVRDVHISLSATHAAVLVCGPIVACTLGAILGTAVGALIRNQVGAIVVIAAYAFAVDAVLFASVPSIGRYLPGKASDAMAGLPTEHLLAPAIGAVVYLTWTLMLLALATVRNDRSDI